MAYVRAVQGPNRYTVGTTPVRVADKNKARASLTIEADPANTGIVYFSYDNPNLTNTGTGQGSKLSAGALAVESAPSVFTGEVWVIADAAAQIVVVFETTDEDIAEGLYRP